MHHIPLTEVGELLDVPYYRISELASRPGGILAPASLIGNKNGWDPREVLEFGIDIGLLDERGYRTTQRRTWETPVSLKWRRLTIAYLGKDEVGTLLGIPSSSVYQRHYHGTFLKPTIYIGRTAGWNEDEVIKFAAQKGLKLSQPS